MNNAAVNIYINEIHESMYNADSVKR